MKAGVRALGIAESFDGDRSTFGGAVVRASRVVDGFAFASATVGGTDAAETVVDCYRSLGREDVRYLLLAGIAPAWYNVVDLRAVHDAVDRPVICLSFEESEGLEAAIRREFDGEELATRLETYRTQPDRRRIEVHGHDLYYRAVGLSDDEAEDVVREFTPEGGRPEPVRVARLAARAADTWRP
ncbi:DUF99 domain-containing protein [Halobacteriales archaeon QS_1_68_20]|nr:MAG: DUF99 domain-containing protein [Halobacteriales archaeon QS_1_68_20]